MREDNCLSMEKTEKGETPVGDLALCAHIMNETHDDSRCGNPRDSLRNRINLVKSCIKYHKMRVKDSQEALENLQSELSEMNLSTGYGSAQRKLNPVLECNLQKRE